MSPPITPARPGQPIADDCPKCGAVHDLTRCKGHKRLDDDTWRQCRARPMTDLPVCGSHGGRAPRSRAAAAERHIEREAHKVLGRLTHTPVNNPLAELQKLAGEARAWKEFLATHVADLERMRYSGAGAEQVRGEVVLFERALDRCGRLLVDIARLNIDERLAAITERQVEQSFAIVRGTLARLGIAAEEPRVLAAIDATVVEMAPAAITRGVA